MVRRGGFRAIVAAKKRSAQSAGVGTDHDHGALLIALLKTEAVYAASTSFGEDYSEYFAAVVAEVAALGDPGALDVLLEKQVLTTGMIAISGIAAYGDVAVPRVASQYEASSGVDERTALVTALNRMLATHAVRDSRNVSTVRSVLLDAVRDDEPMVRIAAIRGLAALPDQDSVRILENLAASDLYSVSFHGKPFYPVRLEAGAALEAIRAHNGGKKR